MTPLADPNRCPSCRSDLPADLVCASCGLDLRGAMGMRLFGVLTQADALIAQMRSRVAVPAPAPAHRAEAGTPSLSTLPAMPGATPPPAGRDKVGSRIGLGTVPTVLLSLGALCVLVAASLFLPFAWSLLGVVGRTVVLILLTVAAGALARATSARGLRATSEALGGVMLGLLTFDLLGARSSGWFGDISGAAFLVLLGAVLVAAGTATTLWLRETEVASFVTGEVVAILGGLLLLMGGSALDVGSEGQRLAVLVPVLAVVAVVSAQLRRPRPGVDSMATAAVGHAAMAGMAWLGLVLAGLGGIVGGASFADMWPGGAGLTLLLAGAYAAAPALVRRGLSPTVRSASLAVALLPWAVAVTAPSYDEAATGRTLVALAPLVVCLAIVQLLPRPWSLVGMPTGLVSALAATALVAPLATTAVATFADTAVPVWHGTVDGHAVPVWDADALGASWLLPLVVVALAATVVVLAREGAHDSVPMRTLLLTGSMLTLLAAAGALLLEGALVWVVVALLLIGAAAASLAAWRRSADDLHLVQLLLAGAALVLSWHDEWLTLAACLALLTLGVAHHVRGTPVVRAAGGLATALLLPAALWTGGALLEASVPWTALVVLLVSGALVIARGLLDDQEGILGIEGGAALAALSAVATGVDRAPEQHQQAWLAVFLTVAGAAVTVVALTRTDRRALGWAGGLLLAAATWVRLAEIGVEEPEPYTLPSAVALLVAGWFRTRRDPEAGTLPAWGPGLCLALVPSLLWAMAEPLSWRAVLLGAACLVLTVGGAQLRLAAPFVWGASVGAVLALWEIVPPAFEFSAWLMMGVVGAGLLVLGASWERRVTEARAAVGYVRGLR